ncbi:hypothetical protein SBF1_3240002 [Candidatus Desulfosporosinus infrequens]|uniref:Uncharacterized protein n=1 Tax=Candidatus Desulfosporosinus infrequens TaxID=2043169 RepID=A0A2U3L015_9FIRM|nr:hypothetical protein SBF1_3240002 [Candidatus Desulfosporosinus infrequens]
MRNIQLHNRAPNLAMIWSGKVCFREPLITKIKGSLCLFLYPTIKGGDAMVSSICYFEVVIVMDI